MLAFGYDILKTERRAECSRPSNNGVQCPFVMLMRCRRNLTLVLSVSFGENWFCLRLQNLSVTLNENLLYVFVSVSNGKKSSQ